MRTTLLLALAAALLTGCAVGSRKHRKKVEQGPQVDPAAWSGVATIAVLPPDCWTSDIDLEYMAWLRGVCNEMLRQRGWGAVPCAEVNRGMNKLKFGMAGELGQLSPEDTAKHFGCSAMLYWAIMQSKGSTEIAFELVKADGTKLWSSGDYKLRTKFNAYPEGGDGMSEQMALAIGEALRGFPRHP